MAILTAGYANSAQTIIRVTYDDGRPNADIPDNANNSDRIEVAEWEALPNTITPFVDVAGRLAEGQAIANDRLQKAFINTATSHQEAAGGNTYLMDQQTILFIYASLTSTTPANITLNDITNAANAVSVANQQVLLDNLKASIQADYTGVQVDVTAVNAAGTVAAIDAALAASTFGDLSPVFE